MHRLVQVRVTRELGDLERLARVRDHPAAVVRQAGGLDAARVCSWIPGPYRSASRSRNALGRVLGVEVEGEPLDAGAEPALQPAGPLEADEAERSDVVAPDGDRELAHVPTLPGASPRTRPPFERSRVRLLPVDVAVPVAVDVPDELPP